MSLPQTEYVKSLPMKQLPVTSGFRPTLGLGSLYLTGDQSIIESYRGERFEGETCRRKRGGLMISPFSFKPGLIHGIKRELRLKTYEIPPVSQVDYKRRKEIDNFYEIFQCHRDQYRDRFDMLHPLVYFKMENSLYQDPPSRMSTYMKIPTKYYAYRTPALGVYDPGAKLEPSSMIPYRSMAGRKSKDICTAWIR